MEHPMQSLIKCAILTLLAFILYGCSQPNQSVKSIPETIPSLSITLTHILLTPTTTISPTARLIASATSTSVPLTTPIPNKTGLIIEENEIIGQASLDPLTFQPVHGSQEAIKGRHAQQKGELYSFPSGFVENGAYEFYPVTGDPHFKVVRASDSAKIVLQQDGKTILNIDGGDISPISPLRGLWVDDDHWTLEIASVTNKITESSVNSVAVGQIYQDGKYLNDLYGYEEMFGYQILNGKPFYFYKKDRKIHLSYNNEDLPILYDEVPHYGCCSSAELNPIAASNWIDFWGKREGIWYYTEIGRY
jgi:hypothetical protein